MITRTDVDWAELDADLVLTTIADRALAENVVVIQPFLTEDDIENMRRAIAACAATPPHADQGRPAASTSTRPCSSATSTRETRSAMIRLLGERMIEQGIIDERLRRRRDRARAHVVDGLHRQHRRAARDGDDRAAAPRSPSSSTTSPMQWGENRVNVIALIAFAATGRTSFQDGLRPVRRGVLRPGRTCSGSSARRRLRRASSRSSCTSWTSSLAQPGGPYRCRGAALLDSALKGAPAREPREAGRA